MTTARWSVAAALCAALSVTSAAQPAGQDEHILAMSVERADTSAALCPGEPVALRIVLRNPGQTPLALPDWEHFTEMITLAVTVTGYPGARGRPQPAECPWAGGPFQKSDFRELPPGEVAIVRHVTPLLPGRAEIRVGVHGPSDQYLSLTDGKVEKVPHAWTGHLYATIVLEVPADESPAMKVRYESYRRRLAEPLVPAEEKARLLAMVGQEKHYLAARWLRQAADSLPSGPLRDAALWQLLKLAKLGIAYEHVGRLLDALTDGNVNQSTREELLAWAAASIDSRGHVAIADQASYVWPDELLAEAQRRIKALLADRNPYFAARARQVLERLDTPADLRP